MVLRPIVSARLVRKTASAFSFAGLIALLGASGAAPASAQPPRPAPATPPAPRPVGVYNGVEAGEAQPPPAFGRVQRHQTRRRRRSEILTWPGFTPLSGGGSRFFVQTMLPMQPEVHREEGRVVVLFRNTRLHLRNSRRWLETRFFNTPVVRARLERHGRDVALVMMMREGVAAMPQIRSEAASGGVFNYVYLDFPAGDYAPAVTPPPEQSTAPRQSGTVQPPAAPARPLDPELRALDNERPPGQ